jgi:transmembrane sensor
MIENTDISAIDLLISKYLSGNTTPEEEHEFLKWMENSTVNKDYYIQSQLLWFNSEKKDSGKNENRWEQLQLKLQEREAKNLEKEIIVLNSRKILSRVVLVAATMLLLIGLSSIFYFVYHSTSVSDLKQNIVEIPYGSRSTLTLPDGTKLWVNSGSRLTYNSNYGKDNRDIYLTGEAYFDVAKNRKLPFIVHASNLKIKAVGTCFNVKAYPEEKKVETTLVRGLVEITKLDSKSPILMRPSQKVTISEEKLPEEKIHNEKSERVLSEKTTILSSKHDGVVILNKEVDTNRETSWKDGKLIFDMESLLTLTKKLERRYDVHFTFENKQLTEYKYTGTFKDLSLEQIMEAMRISSPIDFIIIEKEVYLKEKNKLP